MSPWLAIDFEGSCLPRHGRSFPIEAGIANLAGWSRAWLNRPHGDWAGWTWTARAEALHGLSLNRLRRERLPATQVAAELSDAAAGRRAIADSHLDAIWQGTLYTAAGRAPPVPISRIADVVAGSDASDADVRAALDAATRLAPTRHRAETDARWLTTLIADLVRRAPAEAPAPAFPWALPAPLPSRV